MLDTNVPARVENFRTGDKAKAQSHLFREASVLFDLVDGLARHAGCTGQGGLIAAEQGKCIGLLDWRLFLHGWR